MLYIEFLHVGLSTLGLYPEDLDPEISTFSGLPEQKCNVRIRIFWKKVMVIKLF